MQFLICRLLICLRFLPEMKEIFQRTLLVLLCLILLAGTKLSAKVDSIFFIGEKIRKDTTSSIKIFDHITWQVEVAFITTKPDTLLNGAQFARAELNTDLYIDSQFITNILAIHYQIEGSVAVWLNGQSILATGAFGKDGRERNPIQDDYVDFLFREQLNRLRIVYLPYKTDNFELGMAIYEKKDALKKMKDDIADDNESFSAGSYYLAFGIVFLTLFFYFREKTEHLYFSLFCLFAALSLLWPHLHTDLLYHLESFFGIFCFEFLSIFFCKVLRNKEKTKIPLIVMGIIMLLCFIPFVRYGLQSGLNTRAPWIIMSVKVVLYCYVWISTLYYLLRGIGQKRWEVRVVLWVCFIPIVVFLGAIFILIFAVAADAGKAFDNEFFPIMISYLASSIMYIYPLAAVFILGRRNGLDQRMLIAQVDSIRQLSEENLAKEKEKQDLLAGQNEVLEKEVLIRTSEVVAQKEEIEHQHAELKAAKKKSDDLLLNILPAEVAEELKANGATVARHYDNVSVLFTDFVNFTKAGEHTSPQALIDELHACFKAFDEITGKYGIEKIKTIGDAYLAVAGLPKADPDHALNMVRAAKEISAFMANRLADHGGDLTFRIRIGIHSGSVVAGIVGVKKFAYDIWGDTVNTAARMEQHGAPGRINISQNTYELVKDAFTCEYRGELEVKGKGEMKMYFVD